MDQTNTQRNYRYPEEFQQSESSNLTHYHLENEVCISILYLHLSIIDVTKSTLT